MADNYLEKKFEQLRSGKPVYRKVNPSLDTLLTLAASGEGEAHGGGDAVKAAQLEAIARSASRSVPNQVNAAWDEPSATISIGCPGLFQLGSAVLAARLKACELHLRAECTEISGEDGYTEARAVLKIGR